MNTVPHMGEEGNLSFVGQRIRALYDVARTGKPDFNPVTNNEGHAVSDEDYAKHYRDDCEVLGQDILPEELLNARLLELSRNRSELQDILKNSSIFAIAVFPTSDMGRDLTTDEIADHHYLRTLFVSEDGQHASTLSLVGGKFLDAVPVSIKPMCSLKIEYTNLNEKFISDKDFAKIYNFYIDAFNAWRTFLGMEPITSIEKMTVSEAA